MIAKLRDNRGETLIEVLCAVLVSAVSVALLFGAIMASAKIDKKVENQDKVYYNDLTKAERQSDGDAAKDDTSQVITSDVMIKIAGRDIPQTEIEVTLYGNERLYSYAKKGG